MPASSVSMFELLPEPASVLVADPPWAFGDSLPGKGRGAQKHYALLNQNQIARFPLPPFQPNAILFLWRVAAMQEEALHVARTWGFRPVSEIVWLKRTQNGKRHFGMGRYVRAEHETCLIATRGRFKVEHKNIRSTFEAPIGEHSQKPDEFFRIVEALVGNVPGTKIELFSRAHRDGWYCFGNEIEPPPQLANEAPKRLGNQVQTMAERAALLVARKGGSVPTEVENIIDNESPYARSARIIEF